MRVLHIENANDFTGGFNALMQLCEKDNASIVSIIVIKAGSKCIPFLESKGYKVYTINFKEINRKPLDLLLYLPYLLINGFKLSKIVRKEKIDLIHANDIYNLSAYVSKYLFFTRRPIVVHIRLLPASFPKLVYSTWRRIHLLLANALIAVSHAVKHAYNDSPKIRVIYDAESPINKLDPYTFEYNSDRPFRFVYVANYTPGKGQDLAIEAMKKLVERNPNVTLTFAGGDLNMPGNIAYKNALIEKTKVYGLEEKIFFEGFANDVERKMKQYDSALNFSYSESFSFTCYEALKYGIPLIASNCGGPAELFENGKSGILVENKSVDEMSTAMHTLSTNPTLCRLFSVESRKYIQTLFEKNSKNDTFLTIAHQLIQTEN